MVAERSFRLRLIEPSEDPVTAMKVSELLMAASSDLAVSRGGHVPDEIVANLIQQKYTTPGSVAKTFANAGYRFVLLDEADDIAATVLVAKSPEILLAKNSEELTSLSDSTCPPGYHCLFNLAVRKDLRRKGLARELLGSIEGCFRKLLRGTGYWIRAEPPDHDIFIRLGFDHWTAFDGFFDGPVSIPPGFGSVAEFNACYVCGCPRSPAQKEHLRTRKYKYGAFVRGFGGQ